jgi:diguanylate cyclase (GGDEF)-like protein
MSGFAILGLYAAGLIVSLGVTVWYFRCRVRHFEQSLRDFAELISQMRGGKAPIEELKTARHAIAPVADQVKLILQELRQQKQSVASLNQEIAQRIENRTSALQRLVESLRHQATRDPLTGLYNRRMLDELLPQLVRQCMADNAPCSMLVLDIENFRHLDGAQGMIAGDEMMRTIGQIIRGTLRGNDVAFRYAEDQFVLVFPGYTNVASEAVATRLGALLRSMVGSHKPRTKMGLGIGICSLADLINPSAENLLRGAAESLAANKATAAAKASAETPSASPSEDKRMVG